MENTTEKLTSKDLELYYRTGVWYSVTICPDDQHQWFGKEDRLKRFTDYVNAYLLDAINSTTQYIFFIELSEPYGKFMNSLGPRLHLHGKIKIREDNILHLRNFLLNGIYKLTRGCLIDIHLINDMKIWDDYCQKHAKVMRMKPLTNHFIIETRAEKPSCDLMSAPKRGRPKAGVLKDLATKVETEPQGQVGLKAERLRGSETERSDANNTLDEFTINPCSDKI